MRALILFFSQTAGRTRVYYSTFKSLLTLWTVGGAAEVQPARRTIICKQSDHVVHIERRLHLVHDLSYPAELLACSCVSTELVCRWLIDHTEFSSRATLFVVQSQDIERKRWQSIIKRSGPYVSDIYGGGQYEYISLEFILLAQHEQQSSHITCIIGNVMGRGLCGDYGGHVWPSGE